MTNEITKLYENAGVEPEINYVCDKEPCEQHSVDCQKCSHLYDTREDYPDFTAEKQIEIVKWLSDFADFGTFSIDHDKSKYGIALWVNDDARYFIDEIFEECIAKVINNLWQDLTEEDKTSIKNILEIPEC